MNQLKRESIPALIWQNRKSWLTPLIVTLLIFGVAVLIRIIHGPLPIPRLKV